MTNLTQLQIDVAEWLITNKDALYEKIHSRHIPSYHLFPGGLYDVYVDTYKDNVLSLLKKEIQEHFNLNYEELSLLLDDKEYIILLTDEFFSIPEKK